MIKTITIKPLNFLKQAFLILIGSASLMLASCSKHDQIGGFDLRTVNKADYAPYTLGSSFTYQEIIKNGATNQFDTMMRTMVIKKIENYNDKGWVSTNAYSINSLNNKGCMIRGDENGVDIMEKQVSVYGNVIGSDLQLPALQLPAVAGKSWQSDVVSFEANGKTNHLCYQYTITQTGISKTMGGRTFNNVVEVKEEECLKQGEANPVVDAVSYRYFDKTAGYIGAVSLATNFFNPSKPDTIAIQNLVNYNIK